MKSRFLFVAVVLTGIGMVGQAQAECQVHYERTACQGQQAVSFKKCGGKASCTKVKPAENIQQCWQAAIKSCNNGRLDITKYKKITASYNGTALVGGYDAHGAPDVHGANFCTAKRPDLNACP